jgi:DNA-binding IclR family transcriptional regulator
MMYPYNSVDLEQRAESERLRLQRSVTELRSSVRERLDLRRAAHDYLWQASAVAGALALALGYGVAAIFRD